MLQHVLPHGVIEVGVYGRGMQSVSASHKRKDQIVQAFRDGGGRDHRDTLPNPASPRMRSLHQSLAARCRRFREAEVGLGGGEAGAGLGVCMKVAESAKFAPAEQI